MSYCDIFGELATKVSFLCLNKICWLDVKAGVQEPLPLLVCLPGKEECVSGFTPVCFLSNRKVDGLALVTLPVLIAVTIHHHHRQPCLLPRGYCCLGSKLHLTFPEATGSLLVLSRKETVE